MIAIADYDQYSDTSTSSAHHETADSFYRDDHYVVFCVRSDLKVKKAVIKQKYKKIDHFLRKLAVEVNRSIAFNYVVPLPDT